MENGGNMTQCGLASGHLRLAPKPSSSLYKSLCLNFIAEIKCLQPSIRLKTKDCVFSLDNACVPYNSAGKVYLTTLFSLHSLTVVHN